MREEENKVELMKMKIKAKENKAEKKLRREQSPNFGQAQSYSNGYQGQTID